MSRKSLALKEARLPRNDFRLDGQLLAGESERFLRERLGHARELEHDAPRLHDRDPVLWRALARPHARLGRLLGHRLVGEDVDPDLPAALDLARHRDSSGLDLAVRYPSAVQRLQAVLAELHARAALGHAGSAAAVLLAVLDPLRLEHG